MDTNTEPIDEATRTRPVKLGLLSAGFVSICVLFLAMFTFFRPDQLSLSDRYFPSPTPSITPSPTLTPTPTITPTPTPNQTATVQAYEAQATSVASQWPVLLSESFDTNDQHWDVGSDNDKYAAMTKKVTDGKYQWTVTAHQGFIGWANLDTKDLTDFSLSVDARESKSPNIGEYGFVFREDRDGNYYYFGINHNHEFFVQMLYNDDWEDLILPTYHEAIRPVGSNRLTIVAQGSHFLFFINNRYVAEVTDDRIKTGVVGIAVVLYRTDDKSDFEFDNLQLNAP